MATTDAVNKDVMDLDFIWEDYLEETKSLAAPPTAFVHVEYSLESGFQMGMKMEVPNKEEEDQYWVASVIMTCGPLLSIRYVGYGDDRSADFWLDVKSGDIHPIGWCHKNNKVLSPPKGVRERHTDISLLLSKELSGATSVPASLLANPAAGITPIDQIKTQMKVEMIDDLSPKNVWIATIIQNVGGRLLLRYDGTADADDFWLFYLSPRVHQVGWAKNLGFSYSPPESKKFQRTDQNWNEILSASFEEAKMLPFPADVLECQFPINEHKFEEGMKLEALNPETLLEICPATVAKVVNKYYFMVSIDSYADRVKDEKSKTELICCHSNSYAIFPINWASENGLELTCPEGYKDNKQNDKFDWNRYLDFCNARAAPRSLFPESYANMGFDAEMKLEAVNPFAPDQVCAATVKKVTDPLMWIRLESVGLHSSEIITTVDSFDIFPVGWCGSNGYPLQAPVVPKPPHKYLKAPQQSRETNSVKKKSEENDFAREQSKAWCPRIYFNHRCFSGPLLSKGRLAELPKQVGPGPISLVMKEVLTMLINVAYKSSRVLSELQLRGKPNLNMQQQIIKAKYKGKSYRATVEFIRSCDQLEEFCRMICKKLDCCPYLFGPFQVGEECPEKCHNLTKTKFGHSFVKKHKKPGRPPLSSYGTLAAKKGPGRKKKRIHWRFLRNLGSSADQKQDSNDSEEKTESEDASAKRSSEPDDSDGNERKKHKPTVPPRSEIVTRGAKLPNFGLEMKWRHNVSPFLPRKVGRPPGRPSLTFTGRKVGRPLGSKKKIVMPSVVKQLRNSSHAPPKEVEQKVPVKKEEPNGLNLKSDPVMWSVDDVVRFVKETECAPMAWVLKEQEIDGQALLMLTLPSVQEFLQLKLEPAKLLCSLVEKVKLEYLTRFAQNHS